MVSIAKTNTAMGVVKSFLPHSVFERAVHREMDAEIQRFHDEGFKGSEEPN